MKTYIKTLLDSFVFDNEKSIIENGGNVAEYIIAETRAQDQGWLWFLSEEEIEEFENNPTRRKKHIGEITKFVNDNYDYLLLD